MSSRSSDTDRRRPKMNPRQLFTERFAGVLRHPGVEGGGSSDRTGNYAGGGQGVAKTISETGEVHTIGPYLIYHMYNRLGLAPYSRLHNEQKTYLALTEIDWHKCPLQVKCPKKRYLLFMRV